MQRKLYFLNSAFVLTNFHIYNLLFQSVLLESGVFIHERHSMFSKLASPQHLVLAFVRCHEQVHS